MSDGWRQGARFCGGKSEVQDQDKATALESVNEIHAFGLHDKRRTRHKERERKGSKVAVVSRCGKEWDRSRDVNR